MDSEQCLSRASTARSGLLLVGAGTLLAERADDTLGRAGLTGRDWTVLAILDEDGPGSQQELARLMGRAPAVIVAAVDVLEERGLVERTRDPADRRRSRVTITPQGAEALRHGDRLADEAVASLLAGLDPDELRQLHDLLARGLAPAIEAGTPAAPAAA